MKSELPEMNLGDFMLTLLVGMMAGLRDRLALDGFIGAADLVADLVDITGDYLTRAPEESDEWSDSVVAGDDLEGGRGASGVRRPRAPRQSAAGPAGRRR